MKALPVPSTPLGVVYTTILLLLSVGAVLLLTLIVKLLPPFWSRTVIVLQGVALAVVLIAYRWRPSKELIVYPILIAAVTYLWDETLPPPSLTDSHARFFFPLICLAVIGGDLALSWRRALPFAPRRLRVYGDYVNLDEAAHFFHIPPDVLRAHLARAGRPIIVGRSGEEYVLLDDLTRAVAALRA
jgi:hypothetical protein